MKAILQIFGFFMAGVVGAAMFGVFGLIGGPVLYLMLWGWSIIGAEQRDADTMSKRRENGALDL